MGLHTLRLTAWQLVLGFCLSGASTPRAVTVSNPAACPDYNGVPITSIRFEGLNHTHASVVQRALRQRVGEPLQCAKWELEYDRLTDLDVFADIALEVGVDTVSQMLGHSEGIPLVYHFRELPPYLPYISMSKTDQDGFSAGPGLASLNFLGTGAHLELAGRFGGTTEYLASASGIEMGAWPIDYDFALIRVNSWNSLDAFHEDSWRWKGDVKPPLYGVLRGVLAAEYFSISSDTLGVTLRRVTDRLPRVGVGFALEARDRRHRPRNGLYAEIRLTQTGGPLGGPADFREWLIDLRAYRPFSPRNVLAACILQRYRDGTMGQTVGYYDDFHTGGANSLRGFPHNTTFGKSETVAFLEHRFTAFPQRVWGIGKYGVGFGLDWVAGLETAHLWNHNSFLESEGLTAIYTGIHVTLGGLDRIRLEGGSNISRFAFNADAGFFDKADAQRFRTR